VESFLEQWSKLCTSSKVLVARQVHIGDVAVLFEQFLNTESSLNTNLNDACAKHIGEVLEKLNIKTLNLSRNQISDSGAEEIAKGLAANISLTELNLEDNLIGGAGASHLAANLASKPALTSSI